MLTPIPEHVVHDPRSTPSISTVKKTLIAGSAVGSDISPSPVDVAEGAGPRVPISKLGAQAVADDRVQPASHALEFGLVGPLGPWAGCRGIGSWGGRRRGRRRGRRWLCCHLD